MLGWRLNTRDILSETGIPGVREISEDITAENAKGNGKRSAVRLPR